jgi:hypothetical protein
MLRLAAGYLGRDVVGGDPRHHLGHVAGLRDAAGHRRLLRGLRRDGHPGGVDSLEVRVLVARVGRDEPPGVTEARRVADGLDVQGRPVVRRGGDRELLGAELRVGACDRQGLQRPRRGAQRGDERRVAGRRDDLPVAYRDGVDLVDALEELAAPHGYPERLSHGREPSAPSSNAWRLLARDHAAPEPDLAPWQGSQPSPRASATSGSVLATQNLGRITGRGTRCLSCRRSKRGDAR